MIWVLWSVSTIEALQRRITVYRNRAVLFVRASWGKIRSQEDFLDTEKVAAFDDYLSPATRAISAPSSQATTRPGY